MGGPYTPRMQETAAATPQEAHDALNAGAMLVDVREVWEHDQLRIPGAILIPLGEVPQRLDEIPEEATIYVYCRMGGRSARAVDFLRAHGRKNAFNVSGGIDAWMDAGLPVAE